MRKYKLFSTVLVGLLALSLVGCGAQKQTAPAPAPGGNTAAPAQTAQAAKDFFKGKTMTIIVPYSVGGGFDKVARLVAPGLEKELGVTAVVKNEPGAGGLLGANDINNAKPDGLTIGILNVPGMIYNKLLDEPNAKFDLDKMSWVGRATAEARALVVGKKSTFTSVDDFVKANRPIKVAITGKGSDDYFAAILEAKAFGYKLDPVTGYDGGQEANLGAARGDTDATQNTTSSVMSGVTNGDLKPILQIGDKKSSDLPNVPLASDVVKPEGKEYLAIVSNIIALDRSFAAPPGVPADRLKVLSDSLVKVLQDPDVKANAGKSKIPLSPLGSEDTSKLVKDVFQKSSSVKQLLKDSMK